MTTPVRTYNPTTNLLDGIRNIFPLEICPWDDYYLLMAQSDFLLGRHKLRASKTAFIRNAPFGGSFAHLGGLTHFLRTLQDFRFNNVVGDALLDMGYKKEFVDYLKTQHNQVDVTVFAPPEGSIIFPNEPETIFEGSLLDIRIAEGMYLPCVNYASLALTKWARVIQAANPGMTMEFARRRAQDILRTSLMGYLAGVNITSNADLRAGFKVLVKGTMGHEWIQCFGDEFEAFDKWLEINPDRPVLLVDTIDTLRSGLPNAIKAFKKHWERIKAAGGVPGIRNDSGDLAYITIEERKALDDANLKEVLIFQTNDLDEYKIETMREQIFTNAPRAGLDPTETIRRIVWACGTQPGTCSDQPSIGGVAKLGTIEYWGEERAVIKLANDTKDRKKTSIPGSNRSTWIRHKDTGDIICCLIHDRNEDVGKCAVARHPDDEFQKTVLQFEKDLEYIPRQRVAYRDKRITDEFNVDTADVQALVKAEEGMLHWTLKRLVNPHTMKVSLSDKVYNLRKRLISNNQLIDR